jgi:uncharacterized protein
MRDQAVIDRTRRWISTMVIGLNLCPFARRVFEANTIRYVVSKTNDVKRLLDALTIELTALASTPIETAETTLLIHPHVLGDFLDYNDFLALADRRVADLGLEGVFQIASFHPAYRFAESEADAVENYTNRSPYPMLHLLREESISAVSGDPDELLKIPQHNIETLRRLGRKKVLEMNEAIEE